MAGIQGLSDAADAIEYGQHTEPFGGSQDHPQPGHKKVHRRHLGQGMLQPVQNIHRHKESLQDRHLRRPSPPNRCRHLSSPGVSERECRQAPEKMYYVAFVT